MALHLPLFRPTRLVLLVGHLLHPLDELAVEHLLDRDVSHRRGGRGTVPMSMARRAPNHVARADLDDGFALALRPSAASRDDERLTERMRVPGGACARFESHARARDTGRLRRRIQGINPDGAGEEIRGSLLSRL